MRVRVKICGITRAEDGVAAAQAGADAIGLVFYAPSPRAVSIAQARVITASLPPFVSVVGLFVDADAEQIHAVLEQVPLDLLQFHGDECPAECGDFGRPYIKAVRMREGLDVRAYARTYPDAAGLLLDAYDAAAPQIRGGTGQTFDWSRVPGGLPVPLILAGGLTPENVAEAVRATRPYAVDVSGGVEAAKGIKDVARIAAFIDNVAGA